MNKKELDTLAEAFKKVDSTLLEIDKISNIMWDRADEMKALVRYQCELQRKLSRDYNGIRYVVYGFTNNK